MRALITGSAKGIGRSIALRLAKEGYDISIQCNKSLQDALILEQECKNLGVDAAVIQADFSNHDAVENFLKQYLLCFQDTTVLVNNVGTYLEGSLEEITTDDWHELFQTNLNVPFFLSKGLIPHLKLSKGSIINLGVSGLNNLKISQKAPAYFIAKMALLQLTKTLAKEFFEFGVKVNMVSPGYTDLSKCWPSNEYPFNYTVKAEEVAEAICFLVNTQNTSITGQNLEVAASIGLL